jgi:hypothetical protein
VKYYTIRRHMYASLMKKCHHEVHEMSDASTIKGSTWQGRC